MNGKQQMLVNAIALHQFSPKTVRLMSQHLEHFEDNGSTFSADFENTALHAEVHCETLGNNRNQLNRWLDTT
jgi:hypothetical protein